MLEGLYMIFRLRGGIEQKKLWHYLKIHKSLSPLVIAPKTSFSMDLAFPQII
jgi:hypothetical protein